MVNKMTTNLRKLYDKNHKVIYAVLINVGGLLHNKVYTCKLNDFGYWDRSSGEGFSECELEKYKLGPNKFGAIAYFIFLSKEEATTFLNGGKAVLAFMKENWLSKEY